MTTTYLLGAGFSKAIHPAMPLMRELTTSVREILGNDANGLDAFSDDVEAWLSYLASEQPWLTEDQTLANRARFIQASRALATALEEVQPAVDGLADASRILIDRLTRLWCDQRADVLTFNYDLLVEQSLWRWERRVDACDIYPLPIVERHATGSGGLWSSSSPETPLPRLFKLHGSLNWLYPDGSDVHGPVTARSSGLTSLTEATGRDAYLYSDLVPLIVPPTSSKATFYAKDALRVLWRGAAHALSTTDHLVIIGYSFPPSDLQVSSLIRTCLTPGAKITVVDRTADIVADRIRAFLPAPAGHRVHTITGDDALACFADQNAGDILRWHWTAHADHTTPTLNGTPADTPIRRGIIDLTAPRTYVEVDRLTDLTTTAGGQEPADDQAESDFANTVPPQHRTWSSLHVPDPELDPEFEAAEAIENIIDLYLPSGP